MKNKTIYALDANGDEFKPLKLGWWTKDILREGKWVHPKNKRKINVTSEWLSELLENTNKYITNGHKVFFPPAHKPPEGKTYSEINKGYWHDFKIENGELVANVEVPLEEDAKKIGKTMRDVSAWIEFNHEDSKKNKYPSVITHICATPQPVIDSQKNFQPLSHEPFCEDYTVRLSGEEEDVTILECIKEGDVNMELLKELGELLSLSEEELTPESVLNVVKDIRELANKNTQEPQIEPKKEHEKSEFELALEAKLKEQGEQLEGIKQEKNMVLAKKIGGEISAEIEAGKITTKEGEYFSQLLLAQDAEIEHLALSEEGELSTGKINISETARALLNERKANEMVPMDVLSGDRATKAKGDEELSRKAEGERQLALAADCEAHSQEVIWYDENAPWKGFKTKFKEVVVNDTPVFVEDVE